MIYESRKDFILGPDNRVLQNKQKVLDFYRVCSLIGEGGYGVVFDGVNRKTLNRVAIKQMPKSSTQQVSRFLSEIDILKHCEHPHIAKVYEYFEDDKRIQLVLESCRGGELFEKIQEYGRFSEPHTLRMMRQLSEAVYYLHTQKICHRDLKPENFLFVSTDIQSDLKIIDFGLSKKFSPDNRMTTKLGTPYYVSPQVLIQDYTEKCDVWSLGCILYLLLCGFPPFNADTDAGVLCKVALGNYSFESYEFDWCSVSEACKELIRKMLGYKECQRFDMQAVLHHPCLESKETNTRFDSETLKNISKFGQISKLRKVTYTILAQRIDDTQVTDLKRKFAQMDVDGDGRLSVEEIQEAIEQTLTDPAAILTTTQQAVEMDTDKSGHIDWTEFIAAALDPEIFHRKNRLWHAFSVFDKDGSEKLSFDELKAILTSDAVGEALNEKEARVVFDRLDTNHDGEVDFNEFVSHFLHP